MNHFEILKKSNQLEAKLTASKVIRERAKAINNQADGNDVANEIKNDGETLMALATPFNFASAHNFWVLITAMAALTLAFLGTWIVNVNGEIAGAIMYAALATAGCAILVLPYAFTRAKAVSNTANSFPSTIEPSHVVAAHRFIKTFGESVPRGRLLVNTGAAVDSMLAAWVMLGVFSSMPVIAKVVAVACLMLAFIAAIAALANAFAHQLRKIHARSVVRTKEQNTKRGAKHDDDVAYLRSEFGTLCGTDFRQNRWTDYVFSALPLVGMVVLFALVVTTRLLVPQTEDALSTPVLIAVSTLFCLIALTGAVLGAGSHLLPEAGLWQTAIAKRFPSEAAFSQWRKSTDDSIKRMANQKTTALQSICSEADKQSEKANIVIPMPFDLSGPIPRPLSNAIATYPASDGRTFSPVSSKTPIYAPYPVKWASTSTSA